MKLELHQAVYGRVARGLKGGGGGYQWAAMGPEFPREKELLDTLLKVGRCPEPPSGMASPPRHMVFHASKRWVAFARVGFAADASGRVGYLAHYLLIPADELKALGLNTAIVLAALKFVEREKDLPAGDRVLAKAEANLPEDAGTCDAPPDTLALATLQQMLHPSAYEIPTWITGAEEMAHTLRRIAAMQAIMPPEAALQLTFCLNFCHELEGVTYFRLATLPTPEYRARRHEGYVLLGDQAPRLCRYLQEIQKGGIELPMLRSGLLLLSGHGAASDGERLSALRGKMDKRVLELVETEWPDWNLEWLGRDPAVYCEYHALLKQWKLEPARRYFEANPVPWMRALSSKLGSDFPVKSTVQSWVTTYLQSREPEFHALARWLVQSPLLAEIGGVAIAEGLGKACQVADALAEAAPEYNGCLHRALALRYLELLRSPVEKVQAGEIAALRTWLLDETRTKYLPQERGVVEVAQWVLSGRVPERIPDPGALEPSLYQAFANLIWRAVDLGAVVWPWDVILTARPEHRAAMESLLVTVLGTFAGVPALLSAWRRNLLDQAAAERLLSMVERNRLRSVAREWLRADEAGARMLTDAQRARLKRASSIFSTILPG